MMSIKSIYLDRKQLKELEHNLSNIFGNKVTNLYICLRDYIYSKQCYCNERNIEFDGEYLINIFDDKDILELEKLDKNYYLLDNRKHLNGLGDNNE